MDNRVPYPLNVESRSLKFRRKQKMIRRFPLAIAATTLALSLTASASMLGDGQLGPRVRGNRPGGVERHT
jgi:hypothetical protein